MASLPSFSSVVPRHRARVRSPIPPFSGTRPNPSPVLARTLLRYSPGALSVLARTLFRYLPEPFSGTRPEPSLVLVRTLLWYSPGFHHFSVLSRTLLRYYLYDIWGVPYLISTSYLPFWHKLGCLILNTCCVTDSPSAVAHG